jgi:glutamate carboxypeptidase
MRRVLPLLARFPLMGAALILGRAPEAHAQGLSAPERQLAAYVDAHDDEAVALLTRLVEINSGTMNLAGVRDVGAILRSEFDALGFTTRWEDGAAFGRAGHLVAERKGKGPRVLLIGHLDTVFERDSPFQHFTRIDAGHAAGPGVIDMKGGDVVIVQALKALAAARLLDRISLTVVLTGDEEDPGDPLATARRTLLDAAQGAQAALGFENADNDPHTAPVSRRGTTAWLLRVTGTPAHSSQIFRADIGPGAIYEAARILTAFRDRMAGEPYLTFNPGTILGGTSVDFDATQARGTAFGKTNVIAEHVVVAGDLRTLSPDQLERAKGTMQAVVAESLPHTTAELSFEDGYPPMAPTDGNRRLLGFYDQASRDLGLGGVAATDPQRAGAADVSFVAGLVPMAMDGLGPKGSGEHTTGETLDLSTLPMQTKRAAVLLYRLGKGKP